jgi:acetyltransferase
VSAILERFRPLFYPRGIVVTGVSEHPGKFGSVAYHNLLRFGYQGELFPLNRQGAEIFGRPTLRDLRELAPERADLVFVCTPTGDNPGLLRDCA